MANAILVEIHLLYSIIFATAKQTQYCGFTSAYIPQTNKQLSWCMVAMYVSEHDESSALPIDPSYLRRWQAYLPDFLSSSVVVALTVLVTQ